MSILPQLVECLLVDCGFSEELYVITQTKDEVHVEVDEKEAADYILKIASEEQYNECMAGQYSKNGKRHRISFFLW